MARMIAILGGTGPEGTGLANRLARAGEHVVIGSRDAQRAQDVAKKLRAQIGGSAQIGGTDNAPPPHSARLPCSRFPSPD